MDKKKLAAMLGLPENATEAEIEAKIKANKATADAGPATTDPVPTPQAEDPRIQNLLKREVSRVVNEAISSGKIKAEQRDTFQNVGMNDLETLETMLSGLNPKPEISNGLQRQPGNVVLNKTGIPEDRQKWTYTDWAKHDSDGLEQLQDSNPEYFNKLVESFTQGKDKPVVE